jgi:thiamine-phosphate pyrophosphorylase
MKNLQLCYITDRRQLRSASLAAVMGEAARAGVDLIQVREKDLTSRELIALVKDALISRRDSEDGSPLVVVNDRVDVALAAGADGVHLGVHSIPARVVRQLAPWGFIIGVSCHGLEEAVAAESAGADYLVLGPIFETPSKLGYGPPLGLEKLRNVTSRIKIPVLALGGISVARVRPCLQAGACGIAGIRIFQDCESIPARVREVRAQFPEKQ